jgi:hypothetical protein
MRGTATPALEALLHVAQLVFMREAAQAQRMLVERREDDAVGQAAAHGLGGELHRLERCLARMRVRLAQHRRPAAHGVLHQQAGAARLEAQVIEAFQPQRIERSAAGDALAALQHQRVGDQQQLGGFEIGRAAQQLDHHLGADAARVAGQQCQSGFSGFHRHLFLFLNRRACRCP